MEIFTKPLSVHHYQSLNACICTHVHHERYRLHLHWRRGVQPCVFEVLEDTRVETILGLQLFKRAHGVGHITAMHVYPVLRANTIHLTSNKISGALTVHYSSKYEFYIHHNRIKSLCFLCSELRLCEYLFLMKMLQPLQRGFLLPVTWQVLDLSVQRGGPGDAISLRVF